MSGEGWACTVATRVVVLPARTNRDSEDIMTARFAVCVCVQEQGRQKAQFGVNYSVHHAKLVYTIILQFLHDPTTQSDERQYIALIVHN